MPPNVSATSHTHTHTPTHTHTETKLPAGAEGAPLGAANRQVTTKGLLKQEINNHRTRKSIYSYVCMDMYMYVQTYLYI